MYTYAYTWSFIHIFIYTLNTFICINLSIYIQMPLLLTFIYNTLIHTYIFHTYLHLTESHVIMLTYTLTHYCSHTHLCLVWSQRYSQLYLHASTHTHVHKHTNTLTYVHKTKHTLLHLCIKIIISTCAHIYSHAHTHQCIVAFTDNSHDGIHFYTFAYLLLMSVSPSLHRLSEHW